MKRNLSILFILASVLSLAAITQAAPPPIYLNYQGYLAAAADTLPYTGSADFIVRICDSESGGSVLWEEEHAGVAVTKGFYNIVLGLKVPLDPEMFKAYDLFVEVVLNSETLAPRKPVTSVARSSWSYLAEQATNATNASNATNATNATNAGHAVWADSAQYSTVAALANHSYTSYFADSSRYCDTAAYARASVSAPHNHLAESWQGTGTLGLKVKQVYSGSSARVTGIIDSVVNSSLNTTVGGMFYAANTYGSSAATIVRGINAQASNNYGTYAAAGEFYSGNDFGGGKRYGTYSTCLNNQGDELYGTFSQCWPGTSYNNLAYGGYFWADGGTTSATKYGVYGKATGSGTNYAGYFEGNVTVTGRLNVGASYTPTSSADANGAVGDITYDASYVYIKTASGWRRSALSSW